MFPIVRLIKDLLVARRMPPLDLTGTHVSRHICWPWDLDIWLELNNGRAMTLYDLGRSMNAQRVGLIGAITRKRWGMTMAGSTVRFRRRIRGFERFEMRSRAVCWDDKFIYLEQSMWEAERRVRQPCDVSQRRNRCKRYRSPCPGTCGNGTWGCGFTCHAGLGPGLGCRRCYASLASHAGYSPSRRPCLKTPRPVLSDQQEARAGHGSNFGAQTNLGLVVFRLGQPALSHAAGHLCLWPLFRRGCRHLLRRHRSEQ